MSVLAPPKLFGRIAAVCKARLYVENGGTYSIFSLIYFIEFPCITGTMRGKKKHQAKSFLRNDEISQRNVVKKKPPETKKTKFFLMCTKEADDSLNCKPVSHNKAKKEKNDQGSKKGRKVKTKNYHNSKNIKGKMNSQRIPLSKYIEGKGRLENNLLNKTYILYNNDMSQKPPDNETLNVDVNSRPSMVNNKTISKQLIDISEIKNITDEQKATDIRNVKYVQKFTGIRNTTDLQDNTDIGNTKNVQNTTDIHNAKDVHNITGIGNAKYVQNTTEKGNTKDVTDIQNTTDIQNVSTSDFLHEQTEHRNIVLDLNVIMESVMARRHEYLQQQIEDGILDSSYVVAGKQNNVQRYIEDAIIDAVSLHKLPNVVTSTIFIDTEDNNSEDTDNIVSEFLDSFLKNKTTPLLKATPSGVQFKYKGKSSIGE